MHIQGNLAWMISELLFPCSEPENNEPWLIDPQHSTAKKWDGPQQVSIPISFPISTMHQVLYDPTCVVRECFFPLGSRNLPNIKIRSNQSIRPEQFSINWDRPKLPLHIQKYPGISRNKEYANPHVSKNMQKHPAGLEMGRVKTAFSCDWQEVNHAFRSVFSCFYVVHEGQFYCDFEFSLGFTVYSWHVGVRKRFLLGSQRAQNLSGSHFFRWSLHLR